MLTRRVIPCLDVKDNKVVKGIKFAGLKDVGIPANLASEYERQGADEIVVLDVTATNDQNSTRIDTVIAVRSALSIPLTVGGGIRNIEDVQRLTDAGADRVSVNSAAVARPGLVSDIARRFGSQCTVVAIDARRAEDGWQVITHSGSRVTNLDVAAWSRQVADCGAGEILLTSFDRDGTQAGYDCELIEHVSETVNIPIIASGGARHAKHLKNGIDAGASAVLLASILHDGDTTVTRLKEQLIELGVKIRPC